MFVGHPILDEIRQGCRLRPTKTVDKSKPIILVEGESLSPLLSQRRDPSPSTTPLPPLPAVDVPPQPPPAGIPPPPPSVKKQHLKPVTNPALLKLGGKTEVNRDELMKAIRGGVRLRKVVTNDKSAPVIEEYEGVTRSRSSRGSSPSCNEYQSDDAYESAQSSLSPLSTSPDLRGYRSEMGALQQNHLQRCEESGTVTARPGPAVRSAPFNDEPHYAVPTVAIPPPPPPPPPPVWAPQSDAAVNGAAPKLPNINNGNEVMASGSEMVVDGTLQKPKKADEHYTSPIPTREMIEAEIPAGCAANRIKFLNSIQSRAQSESPVRQLNRPTIQRKLQSDIVQAPQQSQQTTGTTSADSGNGSAASLGRTLTNRSFNDVNSIKKMAQRFDNKIANNETNMNKSNDVYQRPLHMSVSNGNFQTISTDSPTKIISPTDGTQKPIPGKWMPPPRSLIANKQQLSQNSQDGKTYKPTAGQFSLPKSPVDETLLSNVGSIPAKIATNRTVSQRWPPEQPSIEKTTSTATKLSIINSEQTRNRVSDCSRLSDGERQPQASQGGGVAFLKSQLAQTGNDSQCAAASVQKSTLPLQRPSSPSTARSSSPPRRVAFPARFASSQAHPASVAARRSSFERTSSPVPFIAENSTTRRSATPTLRSQSPALRNASPVPRYAAAQIGESNLPTAQYAQVHQVAPAPHTAQNTPVQRMYASTHNAPLADTVASGEPSSICVEPTAATCLSANTSVAAGGQASPRSTELSILPPTTTAPVTAISRNVNSIYATPIAINTNELPPPVPTTEPPIDHQIPVQLSSSISTDSLGQSSESSAKIGTGPYRYMRQNNSGASSGSVYSTPSSQSLMSPTNTTHSNVSTTELNVSFGHSPNSVSSVSPSTSGTGASSSQRSPNHGFENRNDPIDTRQAPVGASDDEHRSEDAANEPVYSLPTPRTMFSRNCSMDPSNEQSQKIAVERQWMPISNSQLNPQKESLKAQRIDSKTYSIPINAPWYKPEIGKADPASADTAHYAGSRSNDPLSHQGVGRAHRIIIGANDPIQEQQQRFENENPESLRNSFKFTIDLESDEPLRIVQR